MSGPVFDLFALVHLPHDDGAISGAGGEEVRIGTPSDVVGSGFVLTEDVEFTAVFGLPNHDVAVAIGGGEQDAIGAELRAKNPLGVFIDDVKLFTGGGIVAFHFLRRTAESDPLVIRRDVRGLHLIELLAHFGDAFACLHFPNDGMAVFARSTTAHDEQ